MAVPCHFFKMTQIKIDSDKNHFIESQIESVNHCQSAPSIYIVICFYEDSTCFS